MKKTNWQDTLKLWLGALLFLAESAVTGCKKLRTLPKRAMALCLAAAMIAALLPGNILMVASAETDSGLPGARVETNNYGDVFLGGNYIEMGISKHGSFGTSRSPQTSGWHKQSDLSGIGFRSDEDGWDVGEEPLTGDFFLPGSAEERWILSYKADGEKYEHLIADRYQGNIGSWLEEPKTVNASDLGRGILKAVVTGTTAKKVKIEITYSFGINDLFYTTDVKVTNLGDADIEDVRFVRSFDPDQDQDNYSTFHTYNKVICNPDATKPGGDNNYALVVARGSRSLAGFFFLTFDNRARVSQGVAFAPSSAYLEGLWDTAPVTEKTYATEADIEITSENRNGYTYEDSAIALTFNISTLSAAASTELQYYSSLDPDVMSSLKNVLAGNVDYTEEVLTGLYAGASYQITYDGVSYIFKNIPESMIPLVGTAPTTADPTSAVAYDFLGKTITVVEVNELGETVSEEQELTIASRPGEVQPGEILPDVPAPVIENITTTLNGITIDPAVAIQEYSLDGKTWISPTDGKVIFTGLEDGTGYTVYTRVAATSEYPASQVISILVYTDAYKVTLNYGTLGRKEVYAQASGKLDLPHPVFDGYIFMGWYDDAEFTTPHDFTIGVEGDVTLYAKFADYEGDKEALQGAINAAKTDLQTKIDAVNSALANKASTADLTNAVNDLNTAIENAKAYADTQDTALKAAIEGAGSVLNTAIDALKDRVTAIENQINGIDLSQIATNKTAIETLTQELGDLDDLVDSINTSYANTDADLQAQITALNTKLTKLIDETIAELTDSVNKLKDDLNTANGKINTNASDIGTLKTDVSTLKTWKTEAQSAITALQGLTNTQGTNISALQTAVADLQTAVSTANSKIAAAEARIAALEGKVTSLETATTNLQTAVTALQTAVADKADTATVNAAIANLQTAIDVLEAVKDDYATADTALKAELEGKISAAQTAAISAAETLVNNAKAELQSKIDAKADAATTTVAIQNLQAAVAALESVKDDYVAADAALKTELESKISAAQTAAISAAETLVNNAKAELQSKIDAKADAATTTVAIQNLQAAVAALESVKDDYVAADAALKTELESKISAAQTAAISAAETLVNNAKAELTAAINNKADTATLNQKVTDLIAAIAAAEDAAKTYADGKDTALQTQLTAAIATAKGEAITAAENLVNTAKAELQTAINNKADIATLNAKVAELNAAIATAEATAKAYTDSAVTTLNAAIITAKDEAVDAAKDLVDAAKAQLQAAIDNKADTAAVNAAIANLQNAITALQNAKDNYIAADAALKAELEAAIAKAKQEAIDAAKGHIPYIGTNGNWWIGDTDTGVDAIGIKGDTGNGIASITTKKENGVTTITITFTDTTKQPVVFTISDGNKGDTGVDGVGIAKIEKTATDGNVDTYTITLTNGKTFTFTVTNGKDGANGKDGLTPFIGENGNWWIGENDTGVKAAADDSVPVGSGNVTEAEGVNTVTVVAIVIAGVALLGNVLLAVLVLKKKKSLE